MNSIEERIATDIKYAIRQLRGIDCHFHRDADRIQRSLDALERVEAVLAEAMPEDVALACDREAADAERYEDYLPTAGEIGGEG